MDRMLRGVQNNELAVCECILAVVEKILVQKKQDDHEQEQSTDEVENALVSASLLHAAWAHDVRECGQTEHRRHPHR